MDHLFPIGDGGHEAGFEQEADFELEADLALATLRSRRHSIDVNATGTSILSSRCMFNPPRVLISPSLPEDLAPTSLADITGAIAAFDGRLVSTLLHVVGNATRDALLLHAATGRGAAKLVRIIITRSVTRAIRSTWAHERHRAEALPQGLGVGVEVRVTAELSAPAPPKPTRLLRTSPLSHHAPPTWRVQVLITPSDPPNVL